MSGWSSHQYQHQHRPPEAQTCFPEGWGAAPALGGNIWSRCNHSSLLHRADFLRWLSLRQFIGSRRQLATCCIFLEICRAFRGPFHKCKSPPQTIEVIFQFWVAPLTSFLSSCVLQEIYRSGIRIQRVAGWSICHAGTPNLFIPLLYPVNYSLPFADVFKQKDCAKCVGDTVAIKVGRTSPNSDRLTL